MPDTVGDIRINKILKHFPFSVWERQTARPMIWDADITYFALCDILPAVEVWQIVPPPPGFKKYKKITFKRRWPFNYHFVGNPMAGCFYWILEFLVKRVLKNDLLVIEFFLSAWHLSDLSSFSPSIDQTEKLPFWIITAVLIIQVYISCDISGSSALSITAAALHLYWLFHLYLWWDMCVDIFFQKEKWLFGASLVILVSTFVLL